MAKQRVSKAKERAADEFTIHESLACLGMDDTDENQVRFLEILRIHEIKWRTVETRHGPQRYFNKKIINELKGVMEVNREREKWKEIRKEDNQELRRAFADAGIQVPQGTLDMD